MCMVVHLRVTSGGTTGQTEESETSCGLLVLCWLCGGGDSWGGGGGGGGGVTDFELVFCTVCGIIRLLHKQLVLASMYYTLNS